MSIFLNVMPAAFFVGCCASYGLTNISSLLGLYEQVLILRSRGRIVPELLKNFILPAKTASIVQIKI